MGVGITKILNFPSANEIDANTLAKTRYLVDICWIDLWEPKDANKAKAADAKKREAEL